VVDVVVVSVVVGRVVVGTVVVVVGVVLVTVGVVVVVVLGRGSGTVTVGTAPVVGAIAYGDAGQPPLQTCSEVLSEA
jgi:hypothetical protein